MGFIEIVAFFKALPEMVKVLSEIVLALKQLKQESIDKELESIRKEVNQQITSLSKAANDEERKKALLALALAVSK